MSYIIMKSTVDKYVWFRVPRVASRTIITLLDENCITDKGDDVSWSKGEFDDGLISFNVDYNAIWDDYSKIAFIRNPWEKLVSFYTGKIVYLLDSDKSLNMWDLRVNNARAKLNRSDQDTAVRKVFEEYRSFEYFIKSLRTENLSTCDTHYRKQVDMFPVDKMDFIGRYENFETDIGKMMQMLGISSYRIPHIGTRSSWRPYTESYDDELAGIVYDLYRDDIETFGYKFGE